MTRVVRRCALLVPVGALLLMAFSATPARSEDDPSIYHRYLMKGSIVEVSDGSVYLCIGTHDGAAKGQELDVVRVSRASGGGPKAPPTFKRQTVGRVRIDEVVDEHFARATVISGSAEKGDIVELEKK